MIRVVPLLESEPDTEERGLGCLRTPKGNLPLERIDADVSITGLIARTVLTQGFHNPHDVPLEATYVFPLEPRQAVTAMRLTAADRTVDAELKEREKARAEYDAAIAEGKRAAIAEEERPDVFTMRVGNILPGERVTVSLTMVGPLSYEDGEGTYRLPLVVAPRYIPGAPLDLESTGAGTALDTDAVPDASRITPPVLLPGFPNPVRLSIEVTIDPAGLPLGEVRSSLHTVVGEGDRLRIEPGERANRDFILRLGYGQESVTSALSLTPDADGKEGTFRLTLLPPTTALPARHRDVVLLLDRSGSMSGWKMVAARRAAARIVDTLTADDRFAVLAFDDRVEHPHNLPKGLVAASDRHRYRAVEHLARMDARGGTELLQPLQEGLGLLSDRSRDRVLVLVTDGQVGNEDQILRTLNAEGVRLHTVGIDQAVNAGFLGRLAALGGGRCELVESEDRLDDAMENIHRRIAAPVVADLAVAADGLRLVDGTVSPAKLPALYAGAPLVVMGRYQGSGSLTVQGRLRDGSAWSTAIAASTVADSAATAVWARAHLRDLEDRYASGRAGDELEQRIVAASLRFGVLCRFTAWLAVDTRVVAEGGVKHQVIQPVEQPAGWDLPAPSGAPRMMFAATAMPMAAGAPMAMPPVGMAKSGGFLGGLRRGPAAPAPARARASGPAYELADEGAAPVLEVGPQLAVEAQRLRDAADEPWYVRRELLADLGSRLVAMLGGNLGGLAELIDRLRDDRPLALAEAELEELWEQTLAALDQPIDQGQRPAGPKPFWKR